MSGTFSFFERILLQAKGLPIKLQGIQQLSGGCIDQVVQLQTNEGLFLLKWKDQLSDQFEAEGKGLKMLDAANSLRIPSVIHTGDYQNCSYLLTEYIIPGSRKRMFWESFGAGLAEQHHQLSETSHYGLNHNNYIGSLPQSNIQNIDWTSFFIEERLEKQLTLAHHNGFVDKSLISSFQNFYKLLPDLLSPEPSSLLHGDLWSGNFLVDESGNPVLIDPAVYYGNREIELAFTRLFGGFDSRFYTSYQEAWPLAPGFEERVDIYNLYPLLVHVNLFGTSYLTSIKNVLKRYS